jgi:hypothetical protein
MLPVKSPETPDVRHAQGLMDVRELARDDPRHAARERIASADRSSGPAPRAARSADRAMPGLPVGPGQLVPDLALPGAPGSIWPGARGGACLDQAALLQHAPGPQVARQRLPDDAPHAELGEALADQGTGPSVAYPLPQADRRRR